MLVEYWQKFCGHFLSENTVCPLLMLANFETFESWIQPDTILQRFFPIQFLQVQDKAKLFLVMQPLWASCVSMSHYTVTVFLYRIFFFLIFAFVYVHLACGCPIVWKINLFSLKYLHAHVPSWNEKHRKNCECCPCHSLTVSH